MATTNLSHDAAREHPRHPKPLPGMTADLCWIHNDVDQTTIGMSFPHGPLESGTVLDAYREGTTEAAA